MWPVGGPAEAFRLRSRLLFSPAWPLGLATLGLRAAVAHAIAVRWLHDPLTRRHPYLLPLADFASLVVWFLGLFGNTIEWRGRRYTLLPDGRFRRV